MRFVTFTHNKRTQVGSLEGDRIHSLAWADQMHHLIRRGITPNRVGETYNLSDVRLEAPLKPGKIIAIGRNYAEHAAETGSPVPKAPIIFSKFPSSIIGPNDVIEWESEITSQVDWEVELAVIIGKRARRISEADALNHVYGYTIANDISARDLQLRIDAQWQRGKSLDTFCPLGPWIVTRDELPDLNNIELQTVLNGEAMQHGNTKDLIFSVPTLISYCSRMFTLEPGDLILTGTPPGVGEGMKPPRYLQDGDTITVSVSGIGEMTNTCRVLAPSA